MRIGRELKHLVKYRVRNTGRYVFDRTSIALTPGRTPVRVLLASDLREYTSEMQYAPFTTYRSALKERLGIVSTHVDLITALRLLALPGQNFDLVGFKLSFRTPADEALRVALEFFLRKGRAKLAYFDGDDDLGVQWPDILPFVDAWIKKHAFSDRSRYGVGNVGKCHLTEYVHRNFGVSFEDDIIPNTPPVPDALHDKIHVGYNLAVDDKIVQLYGRLRHLGQCARAYDVTCRATVNPRSWIYHLRKGVAPALQGLAKQYQVLTPTTRVSQEAYYEELLASKLCVSPFGYGEICWRDIEAILCGCLLVKPDMGHVETVPNLFVPHETYVPVRWDFSDLAERCRHYLEHPAEREVIVRNAREVLSVYLGQHGFVETIATLMHRIGLGHVAALPHAAHVGVGL